MTSTIESDQVRCEFGQPFEPILRIAVLENNVFPFHPSQLPQAIEKSRIQRGLDAQHHLH